MLGIKRLGWTFIRGLRHQLVPPVVAGGIHLDRRAGALVDDDVLHGRTGFQGFVDGGKQFHFTAATVRTVLRNDRRGLRVLNPVHEGVGGEASEDDRMGGADARAG